MKRQAAVYLIFILAILLIPAIPAFFGKEPEQTTDPFPQKESESLEIMDSSTGTVFAVEMREYLIGALACEMPADFEPEALKAQAVAIHSYAIYMKNNSKTAYAFAVDTANKRGYMTPEQRDSYFGLNFTQSESRIEAAVDATIDYILTYDGAAIAACFHAISPGMTENSANVFASALPYLSSVACEPDTKSASYISKAEFSPSELDDALKGADSKFTASGEPDGWIGKTSVSEAGTVLSIEICQKSFSGASVREALGLRSAAFSVKYEGGKFLFEVRGYGHAVGMSQNCANEFAKNGMTFDGILAYFYTGTTLSKSTEG